MEKIKALLPAIMGNIQPKVEELQKYTEDNFPGIDGLLISMEKKTQIKKINLIKGDSLPLVQQW